MLMFNLRETAEGACVRCCGPQGSSCISLDCPSLYRCSCETFKLKLDFQEERPGEESRPTGLAEKPYGWTSIVIIVTFSIVTFATFHRTFPDLTGLSECSEDLLHVTINS